MIRHGRVVMSTWAVALACVGCETGSTGGGTPPAAAPDGAGMMDGSLVPDGGGTGQDGTTATAPGGTADTTAPDPVTRFRQTCAPCHGQDGEGSTLAYELRHPVAGYATWVIRHGRPGPEFPSSEMPAFDANLLDDATLTGILTWLGSFPQPTDGEGLYLDYCANCHGKDARGGVVAVDLRKEAAAGKSFLAQVRAGEAGSSYSLRQKYMPAWDASALSDAEVGLIQAYVGGL